MGFTNLSSEVGVSALNDYLRCRSYIDGFVCSQADVAVFEAVGEKPPPSTQNHALRWYKQIASYSSEERSSWPGVKNPAESYGPAVNGAGAAGGDDDDDDMDLFGSDSEEDAEAERIREERLAAYADKKAVKKGVIAKSTIILDVKPWSDETDLEEMERLVRLVATDGLIWGASKLVPVAYGVKKLQISCVVEDAKVGTDFLEESITEHEEFVQSVDVVAFQKI